MSTYRNNLPQLSGDFFLTDAGFETTLIFHDGIDLPLFAAFVLLKDENGREATHRYYRTYASLAQKYGVGCILETPTWRANRDWADQLGYSREELAEANRDSVALLAAVRDEFENDKTKVVISGNLGPRGDGYSPAFMMTADEAEAYHAEQIETFRETEADLISALTITYPEEAIGIARAAQKADMPVVISFTTETDGRLPNGQTLKSAVEQVDAATDNAPLYYMVNCAHPTHFEDALAADEDWVKRIHGLRANASTMSHAELDEAEELDDGNPAELGHQHSILVQKMPHLNVLGGCCGTDDRHIEAICREVLKPVSA